MVCYSYSLGKVGEKDLILYRVSFGIFEGNLDLIILGVE